MISEAKGYGFKGRYPAGRSIVEGRNSSYKLTIWAQDIKIEAAYDAYLLFSENRRYAGIKMGALPVDERGKGELRREFTSEDLCGFQLTDIAAVVVLAKDTSGVVSPLCGYRDTPFSWRHGFHEFTMPLPPAAESEPPPTPQNESLPDEEISGPVLTDAPVEEAELISTEIPIGETEPILVEAMVEETKPISTETQAEKPEPIPTETLAEETEPISTEIPIAETESIPIEAPVEEPELLHIEIPAEAPKSLLTEAPVEEMLSTPDDNDKPIQTDESPASIDIPQPEPKSEPLPWSIPSPKGEGEMANAFRKALDQLHADTIRRMTPPTPGPTSLDDLFATRDKIVPFNKQARKTTWIRFTLQDPVPPPTNKPNLFSDPFIQKALEEHEHLILGKTIDTGPRWHIIGVPGVYDQASRQKVKRLGFTQFKCLNDAYPSWGEPGYWLMFVTEGR